MVAVRDQHPVEPADRAGARHLAAQMGHARPQHRVGHEAGAAQLEQDGRVAEPGQAIRSHAAAILPGAAPGRFTRRG